MQNNGASIYDRHAAIITVVRENPDLTYRQVGERCGVSAACVSQIVTGRRGKRRANRLSKLNAISPDHDEEFAAITAIIVALAPLEESARNRVISYALDRLRGAASNGAIVD